MNTGPTTTSTTRRRRGAAVITAVAALMASCAPGDEATRPIAVTAHHFITDISPQAESLACGIVGRSEGWSDIWRRGPSPCTLDAGLSKPTEQGTLAFGDESRLTVQLPDARWSTISMQIRARRHPDPSRSQVLQMAVNGVPMPPEKVASEWRTLTFEIPDGVLKPGKNSLQLAFSYGVTAREAGLGGSLRPVAAVIKELWFVRDGAPPRTWQQVRQHESRSSAEPGTTLIRDAERGRFEASARGRLVLPLDVPEGALRLEMEVMPSPGLNPEASAMSVRITDLDGTITSNLDGIRVGAVEGRPGGSSTAKVPVGSLAGSHAVAVFELDPQPEGAVIAVEGLRFRSVTRRFAPEASAGPRRSSSGPPDIVVITLDAARPDHCSCYGYHRLTTPMIDRLAAQSLVFANAFALAPYTLCSVPTMITGLSFLDHGVVEHHHGLSMTATTLAESLGAAGYRTACFTASPNNSSAKGFDQGYDEFHELWTEAPGSMFQDPHYVSGRVIEWLDALDGDRPFHLQVHYIPPHAPYSPAEPFNLFADPGYDGPCTGGIASFNEIEHGLVANVDQCVDHLIDLYDGNLRAADDAVGQLLAALERRTRWSNTVVLVTSDHGEAFLEHGQMTHNSTVYDEMLRVPFILRLPEDFDTASVDRQRLVTLADIVPTLLAIASVPTSGTPDGIDLLASPSPGGAATARYLIARNSSVDPLLGLRTLRWKAMLTSGGFGALFDLAEDPGERHNVIFERRSEFTGLGLILTDRVSRPPRIGGSAAQGEIAGRDREQLEALGYVVE